MRLLQKLRKKKFSSGNWQATVLSQDGRNTLVKSVIPSLLVYNMSALQLLNKIFQALDKMMMEFWWEDGVDKKKFHTL